MSYTIYNKNTGQISFNTGKQPPATDITDSIPGNYSGDAYYIDTATQQPVAKTPRPVGNYIFDYATKTWVEVVVPATENQVREQRDNLLSAVDRVNPVWYNSLTVEQQTELADYRQALLDITTQSGFPGSVVWPLKPAWL